MKMIARDLEFSTFSPLKSQIPCNTLQYDKTIDLHITFIQFWNIRVVTPQEIVMLIGSRFIEWILAIFKTNVRNAAPQIYATVKDAANQVWFLFVFCYIVIFPFFKLLEFFFPLTLKYMQYPEI